MSDTKFLENREESIYETDNPSFWQRIAKCAHGCDLVTSGLMEIRINDQIFAIVVAPHDTQMQFLDIRGIQG